LEQQTQTAERLTKDLKLLIKKSRAWTREKVKVDTLNATYAVQSRLTILSTLKT